MSRKAGPSRSAAAYGAPSGISREMESRLRIVHAGLERLLRQWGLPSLAADQAHSRGGSFFMQHGELKNLLTHLAYFDGYLVDADVLGDWRAVDDRLLNALLRAVAVASHLSLEEHGSAGDLEALEIRCLAMAFGSAILLISHESKPEASLRRRIADCVRKLVRMQTLQALSCRLCACTRMHRVKQLRDLSGGAPGCGLVDRT
ncbi:hypothetical protein PLESTF_000894300 [Pleodorina starrii]|nr:hypothetical protein PLESTF_000894300 [Pleodorina starrii]